MYHGRPTYAVIELQKLCGIEAYSPIDNVSELTARANDEGWDTIFSAWLEVSRLGDKDTMLVYSVGGGDLERNISPNIVKAVDLAKARFGESLRHRRSGQRLRGGGDPPDRHRKGGRGRVRHGVYPSRLCHVHEMRGDAQHHHARIAGRCDQGLLPRAGRRVQLPQPKPSWRPPPTSVLTLSAASWWVPRCAFHAVVWHCLGQPPVLAAQANEMVRLQMPHPVRQAQTKSVLEVGRPRRRVRHRVYRSRLCRTRTGGSRLRRALDLGSRRHNHRNLSQRAGGAMSRLADLKPAPARESSPISG